MERISQSHFSFSLCGFWHGANYTFLLWGIYHGLFLILERPFRLTQNTDHKLKGYIGHVYALVVVIFGWVLFRAESLDQASHLWQAMLGLSENLYHAQSLELLNLKHWAFFFCLGIFVCFPMENGWFGKFYNWLITSYSYASSFLWLLLFLVCAMLLSGQEYNPFIYFRF